jgi:hypothetical protein
VSHDRDEARRRADELLAERDRLVAALDLARQEVRAEARRGDVLDARVRTLEDECDRLRRDRDVEALEQLGALETLQQELEPARAERGWAAGLE